MPGRAVIVIEAQSDEALRKIQQFTRGFIDAFSAVKAGDPILQSSSVKVQTLTGAKMAATKATADWRAALVLLPGPLGDVVNRANTLAGALGRFGVAGGVVGAMVAVAAAGVGLGKSLADDIERLDNLSRQTGLSVAALQAFEHAARQAGEAPDTLVQGFGRINAAINDVLTGAPNAGKAFQDIGVDLRTLVREGASVEDILEATAKALDGIVDPTTRAARAQEVLSLRGGATNATLAAITKDGLGAYIQKMREAGVVTTEETNVMARRFDAMLDDMGRAMQGFGISLKAWAAGTILEIDRLVRGLTGNILERTLADVERELDSLVRRFGETQLRAGLGPESTRFRDLQAERERLRPPHEIVRPGIIPATRDPAMTDAERRAAEARAKFLMENEAKTAGMLLEQQAQTRQELFAAELQAMDERIRAETATKDAINAVRIQAVDDAVARQTAFAEQYAKDLAQREEAERNTQAAIAAIHMQAVDEREARENETQAKITNIVDTSAAGRIALNRREIDFIQEQLDRGVFGYQVAEDAKLRILQLRLANEIELERQKIDQAQEIRIDAQNKMNAVLETRVTAERRVSDAILTGQVRAAQLSGDAWAEFTARFGLLVNAMPTTMDNAMTAIRGSITSFTDALGDSLFTLATLPDQLERANAHLDDQIADRRTKIQELQDQLLRGTDETGRKLDEQTTERIKAQIEKYEKEIKELEGKTKTGLDLVAEVWKNFLNALLQELIKFMASEGVKAFLDFIKNLVSGSSDGGGSGSSDGGGSGVFDDFLDWLGLQVPQTGAPRTTSLTQTPVGSQRRLTLEQNRVGSFDFGTGRDIFGAGVRDVLGALGGPVGWFGSIGRNLLDARNRATAADLAAAKAAEEQAMAQITAMHAIDRNRLSTVELARNTAELEAQTRDLTQAEIDLIGTDLDLSRQTVEVSVSSREATEALAGTQDALDALGTEAVHAADRINAATDDITAAGDRVAAAAPAPGVGAPGTATGPVDPATGMTVGPAPAIGPSNEFGGGPPGFAGTGPGQSPGPSGDVQSSGATGPGGPGGPEGGGPGVFLRRRDMQALTEETERAREAAARLRIEFDATLLNVDALTLELTDTSAGVGIAAEEASRFVASLVSGIAPTEDYTRLFQMLAQEHGPEFARQVAEAVLQLGLSNEQAMELLGSIQQMGEGVDVPVHYRISVSGSPPPGAGGPAVEVSGGDRQHGLLEGPLPRTGYYRGHQGEVVATPNQAAAILRKLDERGSDPEDQALMREQTREIRRAVAVLERIAARGGRAAGAVV